MNITENSKKLISYIKFSIIYRLRLLMNTFILILLSLLSLKSFAYSFEGFVETSSGSEMFVKYQKAKPGFDTFVFINGLVYEVEKWEPVTKQLTEKGYGVLHYEFEGQYRTFQQSMDSHNGEPQWMSDGLTTMYLSIQLNDVLSFFNLKNIQLIAHSYGTSIATSYMIEHSSNIKNVVFMAPLVIPLENYHSQGQMLHTWFDYLELWGPIGSYWSNYYYDLIYKWYYQQQPSSRDYDFGEWEEKYYISVFHQVKAVKKYNLNVVLETLNNKKALFLTAENENETYLPDQQLAWKNLPANQRGSLVHIRDANHDIPQSSVQFLAKYLEMLSQHDSKIG